jgi:hypothetical protein
MRPEGFITWLKKRSRLLALLEKRRARYGRMEHELMKIGFVGDGTHPHKVLGLFLYFIENILNFHAMFDSTAVMIISG